MKICLAQIHSIKGDVQANSEHHIRLIQKAASFRADLIVFPELSITGYEPSIAAKSALPIDSRVFDPFQHLSEKYQISIAIGMPTPVANGINISMLIFQPLSERLSYSKRMIHSDEMPYFVEGNKSVYLTIKSRKTAFGICFETLQRESILRANEDEANLYIASVAKPSSGMEKAKVYFPSVAREFGIPILVVNSIGPCDDFISSGQSSIWNNNGDLVYQSESTEQELIIYDMDSLELNAIKLK